MEEDSDQFLDNKKNEDSSRELGENSNSEESRTTHMTRTSSMTLLLQESVRPSFKKAVNECNSLRLICGKIVNHSRVRTLIILLIIINAVMMGVATFDFVDDNPKVSKAFEVTDLVFLVIFTVELAMQLVYHGYKLFLDGWLFFDFVIVILSWSLSQFQIIRAFRIFRALRLITRVKVMKNLITALFDIMPRLGAVTALLALIFYIYAVLCTNLFGELELSGDYFVRLDKTLMTLFEMMTMSWARLARECMDQIWWAWLPFVTFIMITGFMVFNLIIAIVCDAVSALEHKEDLRPDVREIFSGESNDADLPPEKEQIPPSGDDNDAIIYGLERRAETLSKSQDDTQKLLDLLVDQINLLQRSSVTVINGS